MRLPALVHHGVDVAGSPYLGGSSSNKSKDGESSLYFVVCKVPGKIGAFHKGRIGEVNDYVFSSYVINEAPEEHLSQQLCHSVAVAAVEVGRVVQRGEERILALLQELAVEGQRSARNGEMRRRARWGLCFQDREKENSQEDGPEIVNLEALLVAGAFALVVVETRTSGIQDDDIQATELSVGFLGKGLNRRIRA